MEVYRFDAGRRPLVGRADVPEDAGPVHEVPLFGAGSVMLERSIVIAVAHSPPGGDRPVAERAVLLSPRRSADLLPGWGPPAS